MRAKGLLWATVLEMELAQATGSAMGQLKERLKEKARVLVWEMLSVLVWALQWD